MLELRFRESYKNIYERDEAIFFDVVILSTQEKKPIVLLKVKNEVVRKSFI